METADNKEEIIFNIFQTTANLSVIALEFSHFYNFKWISVAQSKQNTFSLNINQCIEVQHFFLRFNRLLT